MLIRNLRKRKTMLKLPVLHAYKPQATTSMPAKQQHRVRMKAVCKSVTNEFPIKALPRGVDFNESQTKDFSL
jgi:hypothetical protein